MEQDSLGGNAHHPWMHCTMFGPGCGILTTALQNFMLRSVLSVGSFKNGMRTKHFSFRKTTIPEASVN